MDWSSYVCSSDLAPPPLFVACEGRDGRGRQTDRQDTMSIDPDFEPLHEQSPTSSLLDALQLFGHRPFEDEPDPRPLPEERHVRGAIADIFDALASTFQDTRLEPDLDDLLWATVNLFHRAAERIERELDDNEQAQKRGQREQDGSEVKSVELERRSEEHTSELQSLMRISYAVFCLKKKKTTSHTHIHTKGHAHH